MPHAIKQENFYGGQKQVLLNEHDNINHQ